MSENKMDNVNIPSHFASVNGVTLHYKMLGTGNPMLFLHGFPEFWYMWRKQLLHFAKEYCVVAPDLRGYNLSAKPSEVSSYLLPNIVEDIYQLCQQLKFEKITLVGHDWGGMAAWLFASYHPELVEKLIILNAPHPAIYQQVLRTNPKQQKAAEYIVLFRKAIAAKLLARNEFESLNHLVLTAGLQQGILSETDKYQYHQAWRQPDALISMLKYYQAPTLPFNADGQTIDWSHFDFLPNADLTSLHIHCPTLVIWGEQDQALILENLDGLSHFVSHLNIQRLPNCGHFLANEISNHINQTIRDFLV